MSGNTLGLGVWSLVAAIVASWSAPGSAAEGDDLASKVTIRRDTFGVPHILATTEEAAAFGQGYASAEDRVLVMARLYLQARGEEAAYFGEAFADSDLLVKQLHMHEGAAAGYAKLAPWVQSILDGYAAGYDRYVAQHRTELPEWVKPATGIDILAHGRRVVILEFATDLKQLDRIGQKTSRLSRPEDELEARGSNMWAIGKGRTASGKGILLANPHLTWKGSQLFYEAHLTVPGKINVSGSTLTGGPGITIGFNEHLGWSHTVNLHDSDDVYELTIDPTDRHRYLYDGRSLPLRKEEIALQVKTDKGLEERKKEVYWSHYGPVMKWHDGKAYAFKSANQDEYRFVEQWNLMGKARNLNEFRRALDMQAIPMFNICYADRNGTVFYLFNGRFPDRPPGYNWAGVVPGNTSATEWNHILPQSRLPFLVNPPGGYVQNCNSAPWYTNLRQIIDRRLFPDDLTLNVNGMRQQLSLEMLEKEETFTLDKVLRCKFNTKMLLADRVKADVVKALRGQTVDGVALDEAADVLRDWDNTVARDSKGGLLFVTFWQNYGRRAERPYATPWDERRPAATPSGIGEPDTVRHVMAATVKDMKQKHGRLAVPWGSVHRLRRGQVDVPVGGLRSEFTGFRGARLGDFGTFRIISYEEDHDSKFVARGGDSFVMAVEFTSPPTAYTIVAYSQSEDPGSPHHSDQSVLFAEEKWKRSWFTEDDIARHLERSYHP
jgi:acyl-homoserine-lactone acylase